MGLHKVKHGLDLPIAGAAATDVVEDARRVSSVAVLGADYHGMKPTMHVQPGDHVRTGQLLFEDKKTEGVRYTSPGTGTVTSVNRGAKRAFQSVVVRLDPGEGDAVQFSSFTGRHPGSLSRDDVRGLLLESGLWTALRARPYGRVADPTTSPKSIFVTAMDSEPLAPPLEPAVAGRESDLVRGVEALTQLTDGEIVFCRAAGSDLGAALGDAVRFEEFVGPHPAGTAGLHIHRVDPVHRKKLVWYVGLQDVLAVGHLFERGTLDLGRVISLAGPSVQRPRLLRTRLGANLDEIVEGELVAGDKPSKLPAWLAAGNEDFTVREIEGEIHDVADATPLHRVISGSVLSGRAAMGERLGYLGRYHQQVSVIPEDTERELLGWLAPGLSKYSVTNLFASKLVPGRKFDLSTNKNGSDRAIVPIGLFEKVFPFDLVPVYLLKALVVGDVERAEELGCLELEEDDLALCTFVCPSKIDYGPHLRETLTILEKEG